MTEDSRINTYLLSSFFRVKKEYTALVESGSDPELQSILESNLWFLCTGMSEAEVKQLPEDERNWRDTFIASNKEHYTVVEEQLRNSKCPPFSLRSKEEQSKIVSEGMSAAFQHGFSQKGVLGGLLKQFSELGKVASSGMCPMCAGSLSSDQINQFQNGEKINCEHCGSSMQGGAGLDQLVKDLEERGEVLSTEELNERGIFLGRDISENLRKFKESKGRNSKA
ncbi:MAG: hypothetical protein ACFE95_20715 [Candidatus Hodarchaeota archaeon]